MGGTSTKDPAACTATKKRLVAVAVAVPPKSPLLCRRSQRTAPTSGKNSGKSTPCSGSVWAPENESARRPHRSPGALRRLLVRGGGRGGQGGLSHRMADEAGEAVSVERNGAR